MQNIPSDLRGFRRMTGNVNKKLNEIGSAFEDIGL
jgi:hypothetical protein